MQGIRIEAVPAYNIVHERSAGQPFHPRGEGNGYVLSFGGRRVYVAGDTENTPEMKALKAIDVAFLPMNLPYTMTPERGRHFRRGSMDIDCVVVDAALCGSVLFRRFRVFRVFFYWPMRTYTR